MNKILVVNLKRFGDIFQSGHLIASLKEKSPSTEIHLLCYTETAAAAKILKGVDKVHTLNRKKIISFFKNSIYSDGFAFNEIEQTLSNVKNEDFSQIINYSNDKVSTYLCSFLKEGEEQVKGISFTSKETIQYSNEFALVLNDILTTTPYTPMGYNDCYHLIAEASPSTSRVDAVRSNKAHDQTAANNLQRLRSSKNKDASKVSIVGVQITCSSEAKEIPHETLVETIELIHKSEDMVPILLIAPSAQERARANKINEVFKNRLVSVEADFIALPSVVKNLDLLLTPDTAIKHLSDLLRTPCLEISLGYAPLFKQGALTAGSAIITAPPHTRVFKEGSEPLDKVKEVNKGLKAEFIYETARALLSQEGLESINASESEFCVYQAQKVVDGIHYFPVTGPYSSSFDFKRSLGRLLLQKMFRGTVDENHITKIYNTFETKDVSQVINDEKTNVSYLTKELLSTLRGLIQTQENRQKAPQFIESLERLLAKCFDNNLAALPAMVFRARIESLNSNSMEDNFKEVESLLYELKDRLQDCLYVYRMVEQAGYARKSQKETSKSNEAMSL